jgi:hypothetical protein
MKFTASRLSEGNKVFPAEIGIDDHGVTLRIPGMFGGKTTHLDFQNIGNVSISTPAVGYSTITFHASGSHATAHGFTAGEARQIKRAIDEGRSALGDRRGGRDRGRDEEREYDAWKMRREQEHEREMAKRQAQVDPPVEAEVTRLRDELEYVREELRLELERQALEDYLHPWKNDENFRSSEAIGNIRFPPFAGEIEKTIERIVHTAIKQIKRFEIVEDFPGLSDPEFWERYQETFDFAEAARTKAREGIGEVKSNQLDNTETYLDCMDELHDLIDELEKKWLPVLAELGDARRRRKT